MKDKRTEKIKQHYEIFIGDLKYKVIDCKINEENRTLSIKTKIKGQSFPTNGQFIISIPSADYSKALNVTFKFKSSDTNIEHWEYDIQ